MASHRSCDSCGTRITKENPVVSKLFLAPVLPGKTRSTHSNYTASMDIGKCCVTKIQRVGSWQKRQTRQEYNNGRRLRAAS